MAAITAWPSQLEPGGRFSIEAYKVFDTYNNALAFVKNNAVAYKGSVISIINDGNKNGVYYVSSIGENGNLIKVGGSIDLNNINIDKDQLDSDLYKELIKVHHPDDFEFWTQSDENIDYSYGSRTIALNYDLSGHKATITEDDVSSDIVYFAQIYKWIPIISLYEEANIKEIVAGSFLLYEDNKPAFRFIYNNEQYTVCINDGEEISYSEIRVPLGGQTGCDIFEKSQEDNTAVLKGGNNVASSNNATAFGLGTVAGGEASHAEGIYTKTTNVAEHASGKYNESTQSPDTSQATHFSIGIGTSEDDRKNAFEVKQNGDVYIHNIDTTLQEALKSTGTGVNDSSDLTISEDIPVVDGPLSSYLIDIGVTTIKKNSNLQDLLVSLFCSRKWPQNISSVEGTISAISDINSFSIKSDPDRLVEPGETIKFSATQGSVKGYNSTDSIVSGLTYGYSTSNNGKKDGPETSFTKKWTVTSKQGSYTLVFSGGSSDESKTGSMPQTISDYEIVAEIGDNTCTATSSGSVTYEGIIEEIPVYYGVSNLGDTSEDYKSTYISSKKQEVTSNGTTYSSKTITCVYPCYHNASSEVLKSDADIKMPLSINTSYTISAIPSEESSNAPFVFDFPESATIKEVKVKSLPGKYNVYTGFVDSSNTSVNDNAGLWKTSMIFNAPKESGESRFTIDFPKGATIKTLLRYNDATGKDDVYKNYKTTNVKRGSDSYVRLTMTHDTAQGASKYTVSFNDPVPTVIDDYTIGSETIEKTINGVKHKYKRLTTKSQQGVVDRTITFVKALNNK